MVHRGIATLALALMLCFLLLSHFDPQFFFLHFYESLIYLAITLMLFYFEDRWAYMLGIVAPAGWLLLTFASGGFGEFARQAADLVRIKAPEYPAAFLGGVISILSVAMIVVCARRWKREFQGLGKGLSTFLVSTGIVVIYYGLLVLWFWRSAAAPSHI
jgi:hypothetical protein